MMKLIRMRDVKSKPIDQPCNRCGLPGMFHAGGHVGLLCAFCDRECPRCGADHGGWLRRAFEEAT